MFEADFDPFVELLDAVYSLHGKALPTMAKPLFFRALAGYSLQVVRSAIDAHVKDSQRGQYAPKPADLIAQIEGLASNDSRPGPEEAWAIAVQSFDEAETVMMLDEIAEARGIAQPIFDLGDEVGARMAFREAYSRIVSQSRSEGKRAVWWPSVGTDAERRHIALERAVAQGLLNCNAPVTQGALPAPTDAVPLLESIATRPDAHATLDSLKKMLERDPEADWQARCARNDAQREELAAKKAEAQRQVDERLANGEAAA